MTPGTTTNGSVKTQVLSVMFTDMKGFTTRTSGQSREEIESLLKKHDDIMRPIFQTFEGRIVKTIGDAFLVVFDSPTNAVHCGIAIQKAIKNYNAKLRTSANAIPFLKKKRHKDEFEVRVAINSGEVHIKDEDIFGEPVNIAARVEGVADGGEVCFTESVYLAMNKNEVPIESMGQHTLKGIPYPVVVYRVVPEGKKVVVKNDGGEMHAKSHKKSMPTFRYAYKAFIVFCVGYTVYNLTESVSPGIFQSLVLQIQNYFTQSDNGMTQALRNTVHAYWQ